MGVATSLAGAIGGKGGPFGIIGQGVGGVMGGLGSGIASGAPQNDYRANIDPYLQTDKDKSAAFYDGLPQQLNDMSMGKGPSAADAYMFNANQQATGQANALAQSARGGISPAMALRLAQNSSANAAAQNAGTYSAMKNQEAINAINQRANLSSFYDQLGQNGALGSQTVNAGITQNNTNAAANFAGQGMATLGQIGAAAAKGGGGAAHGGVVAGEAPRAGDHPENDIVPTMLSPGEAVIPRSAMKDRHKAHAFLDAMLDHAKGAGDAFDALIHAHHAKKMACGGMVGGY